MEARERGFVGREYFGKEGDKKERKAREVQKLETKEGEKKDSEEIKRMKNAAFVPFYVAFHVLGFMALGAMFRSKINNQQNIKFQDHVLISCDRMPSNRTCLRHIHQFMASRGNFFINNKY